MTDIASRTDWVRRAEALAPTIEREALQAEERGTLTSTVVDRLVDEGLFAVLVPKELGGGDADLLCALETVEEVARADASTGWSYMVGVTMGGLVAALLGDEAAGVVFGGPEPALLAGMLGPRGTAVPENGGYRLTGRYSFGSGARHATWIASGATVRRAGDAVLRSDGTPEHLGLVVPASQVELTGNWNVFGLQATGSVDYEVPEQHVPEAFTFSMSDPRPQRGRGLYQLGVKGVAAAGHTAVALGIAKRALEEIVVIASQKARPGTARVADQQLFLHDFAVQDAAVRSARAYAWQAFGDAEATADAGSEVTPEQRQRLRQACTYVHRVAADAVRFAYTWAGTTAMRRPNALGRCYRDLAGATQHMYVDPNSLVEAAPVLMAATTRRREPA